MLSKQAVFKTMFTNTDAFNLFFTAQATQDLERLNDYLEGLDTQAARLSALAQAQLDLSTRWKLNPFFDRMLNLRVHCVSSWYSIFYSVDESAKTVTISTVLGQAEDIARLKNKN
jgi:plasmid stabilization system protein ParE